MCGEYKYEKMNSSENLKINMCLESVNQVSVWRVNPETCVESVSMKKIISHENSEPNMCLESVNPITA